MFARVFTLVLLFGLVALVLSPTQAARSFRPSDVEVPAGYTLTVAVEGLAAPSMVTFDDQGRMLIAETGSDGSGNPQVIRIEKDGSKTVLAKARAFGGQLPITAVASNNRNVYVVHDGTVSMIQADGTLKTIISGLPGQGDHQANQIVFHKGKIYLGIGTVTNAGVVGPDNADLGWLKESRNRLLHDVPCQDVTLTDTVTFTSENPLSWSQPTVKTSAFAPFGTELPAGTTITGDVKCSGAILQADLDGSNLAVYAWGFRNPVGLVVGPDDALYATMHGFDARGSRPVENAWDCLYRIEQGNWYGWPDFACDVPATDAQFKPVDQMQPAFLMTHPAGTPPRPIAKFNPHAGANGFAFAPNARWGKPTDAFIALRGNLEDVVDLPNPNTQGKIVKVDAISGTVSDFLHNKPVSEPSKWGTGGLVHPSDVEFGPDGAMYIADWGVAQTENSGAIWKLTVQPLATAGASTQRWPNGVSTTLWVLVGLVVVWRIATDHRIAH